MKAVPCLNGGGVLPAKKVEYIHNEAVDIQLNAASDTVEAITLATGEKISCGHLINAAGPRAAQLIARPIFPCPLNRANALPGFFLPKSHWIEPYR